VLEIKPESSGKATSALKHKAISPAAKRDVVIYVFCLGLSCVRKKKANKTKKKAVGLERWLSG
jgi:predicted peroxiredoxin